MKRRNIFAVPPLTPTRTCLLLILIFAGIIRSYHALNFPLSGDEVGVGVVQATGHALDYKRRLPSGNFSVSKAQLLINYEDDHGLKEVPSGALVSFSPPT